MFESAMSMNAQVSNIVKAANYHLVNISRARRFITTEATKLAIHSLVTSRLDYCNSLLMGITNRLLNKLQCVQRTSARLITNRRKYDPITSELIDLHWLPVKQRIDYKVLMLVYKALHNQAPPDIASMLQVEVRQRRLRSSASSILLVEPRTRCVSFADRSFSAYAPKLWNRLPDYIKNSSFVTFRSHLKAHLFREAYQQ